MDIFGGRQAGLARIHRLAIASGVAFTLSLLTACVPRSENSVVIYSAADREYAQPILAGFNRRHTGIEVIPQFDVESTKTVGLVTRIESESTRPRCDVFWNNEIMHTLRLEKAGLLQPIAWDVPATWPKDMRSSQQNWLGIAARARVLLVNRELLSDPELWPKSIEDLGRADWQGRCGVALPLFGTTATHFAVLHARLGHDNATKLFQAIKNNAVVLAGNKQVAQAVSSGQLAFGLTDTDDALVEIDAGLPVEIVYPDQHTDGMGALRIPNTIAVLAGCPHPVAAAQLANYLASEDTEARLAMGASGQFPLRPGHTQVSRAQEGMHVRWMNVDFQAAADDWPQLADELRALFYAN